MECDRLVLDMEGEKVDCVQREGMTSLLASAVPGVTQEMAWRLIGILFTNCFEFRISDIDARALYPLVSLVNHSCIPNLRHTNLINKLETYGEVMTDQDTGDTCQTQEGGEIVVMQLEAARTILRDTELTIRYNDYMMVGQLEHSDICGYQYMCTILLEPNSASQVLVRAVVFRVSVSSMSRSNRVWNPHKFPSLSKLQKLHSYSVHFFQVDIGFFTIRPDWINQIISFQ